MTAAMAGGQIGDGERGVHEPGRHFRKHPLLLVGETKPARRISLRDYVPLTDRAALTEANELIARFGEHAQLEAAMRADRSRSLGNVLHFCHWRTIERTIEMLSLKDATGTIH
jgi:hypothetical protein